MLISQVYIQSAFRVYIMQNMTTAEKNENLEKDAKTGERIKGIN